MVGLIVLLIAVVVMFVAIHAVILPRIFLRNEYVCDGIPDKGCKIIDEGNGKSILYEPEIKLRKYISKYILSERDGKKFFICRFCDLLKYADYDIVLFNDEGISFKVINVKEKIVKAGYSKITLLPDETAYVTLKLNRADNEQFKNKTAGKISSKNIFWYLLLSSITDILGVISVKACASEIFGGIFAESFMVKLSGWAFTGILCGALIALNILYTVIVIHFKSGKVRKGAENV